MGCFGHLALTDTDQHIGRLALGSFLSDVNLMLDIRHVSWSY